MSFDVEITLLKDLSDILCYLYSDNRLLDAVSATNEPILTSIPYNANNIAVIAKDIVTGEVIFKEEILLEDLISRTQLIPKENPLLIFQSRLNPEISPTRINHAAKSISHFDQIMAIDQLQQEEQDFLQDLLQKVQSNNGSLITDIRKLYKELVSSMKNTKLRKIPDKAVDESFADREYEFLALKSQLAQDIYRQNLEISKLRSDNKILTYELDSCRSELKLQQVNNELIVANDLENKKSALLSILEDKSRELSRKQILALEIQKELKSLQTSHKQLRSYLYEMRKLFGSLDISVDPYSELSQKRMLKLTHFKPLKHRRAISLESSLIK